MMFQEGPEVLTQSLGTALHLLGWKLWKVSDSGQRLLDYDLRKGLVEVLKS